MLIALVILFAKKLIRRIKRKPVLVLKKTVLFIAFMVGFLLQAQTKRTFTVVRNDNEIGIIEITRSVKGDETHYDLEASIKTKFIFNYDIKGVEKAIFKNGKLLYSSIKRQCNNRSRVDKELKWQDGSYQIREKKKLKKLDSESIANNLMTLYFEEPQFISKIYCDKQDSMGEIITLKDSVYKVILPDGNYSIYYYKDNHLQRVKVVHLLYNVELISS